jgi:hypothetical protein
LSNVNIPDSRNFGYPEKGKLGKQIESARFHGKQLKPGTVEWIARQLLDQKPELAIGLLSI